MMLMFPLRLFLSNLVLTQVAQATYYKIYYLDDNPDINLTTTDNSVAKLIGFRTETYIQNGSISFSSKVLANPFHGVVVRASLQSRDPTKETILLLYGSSNSTFNGQDLVNGGITEILFSDELIISFTSEEPSNDPTVEFKLTSFGRGMCDLSDEFTCRNGLCIWSDLKCDLVDNCGDRSDEDLETALCTSEFSFSIKGVIILTTIGVVILILVSLLAARYLTKKRLNVKKNDVPAPQPPAAVVVDHQHYEPYDLN